jgi:hypothetical protein
MKCPNCQIEFQPHDYRQMYCSRRCSRCVASRKSHQKHREERNKKNRERSKRCYIPVTHKLPRARKFTHEQMLQHQRARYANDHEYRKKQLARITAYNALKVGKIIRQNCSKCGSEESQMHHSDYLKPLEIEWLCRPCHILEHPRELQKRNSPEENRERNRLRNFVNQRKKKGIPLNAPKYFGAFRK